LAIVHDADALALLAALAGTTQANVATVTIRQTDDQVDFRAHTL
jgi:hypothetical protein